MFPSLDNNGVDFMKRTLQAFEFLRHAGKNGPIRILILLPRQYRGWWLVYISPGHFVRVSL